MATKDGFQKYLDAGIAFTALTRTRAEDLVHELVQSGEFQSDDARAKVEELIEMARKGHEVLVAQVRHEVTRQMDSAGITNLEDLAKQVASLIGRTAEAGRAATAGKGGKTGATKAKAKASGKTSAAKGSTASAGKTTTVKKRAASKAAAKKSPARKAAGTKAAGTKAAGTKAAGTKAAGTKASAKKTTAKRSPSADGPAD